MLDRVMEELVRLQATDPSIGGTLPDGEIGFSLGVEAETLEKAILSAFGTLRTAIHAAEGATPRLRVACTHGYVLDVRPGKPVTVRR
jgi:hypothetical protein